MDYWTRENVVSGNPGCRPFHRDKEKYGGEREEVGTSCWKPEEKDQQVYFKVDKRAVRDRFNICSKDLRNKLIEKKESAIETDMPDVERALEDLIEREKAAETDQKTKGNQDRENAEDIRKKAMGSLGQTNVKVKKENRKKSSNGSETLNFLREQNWAGFRKCKKKN